MVEIFNKNPKNLSIISNSKAGPEREKEKIAGVYEDIGERPDSIEVVEFGPDMFGQISGNEIIFGGNVKNNFHSFAGVNGGEFKNETYNMIREIGQAATNQAMIGICFGYHIIGLANGMQTKAIGDEKKKGAFASKILKNTKHFNVGDKVDVWNAHRYGFDLPHRDFETVSTVDYDGSEWIEAFVHKNQPLGGVQFHPEHNRGDYDADGALKLFADVRESIIKNKRK